MNGGEYGGEDSDSEAAQKKAREERMIASLKKREEEVKEQMAGHLKDRSVSNTRMKLSTIIPLKKKIHILFFFV